MFILVPAIIIFLLLAYLYLNEVSNVTYGIVYSMIVFIIFISFSLYRKIKKDMKQQEINAVNLEIQELNTRLSKEHSDEQKDRIVAKIEQLQEEIKTKSNT